MRALKAVLMTFVIALSPNAAFSKSQTDYSQAIQQHANLFNLHVRQYLYATQQLSNGHFNSIDEAYVPEPRFFEMGSGATNSYTWSSSMPTASSPEEKKTKKWQMIKLWMPKFNETIVKHANYLNISVLDLKAFYSHRDTEPFRILLSSEPTIPDNANPVHPVAVEILCSQTCNTELLKTDINHVAEVWQASVPHAIPDMQKYIVRFVNRGGEQVGSQEYWRFYGKLGPRYISSAP